MAKKAKKTSKWVWALWLLVIVAGISVFFMPITRPTPKVRWRVPVHVTMPNLSSAEMPSLTEHMPDLPDVSLPDVNMRNMKKLGESVSESLPDLPDLAKLSDFPYEATPQPQPEPLTPPPAVVAPQPPSLPTQKAHGRIALIIDDVGLAQRLSERATKLPASVTLAYLPYAPRLTQQAEAAQALGHDIMLHLPMEPLGHDNPGPDALLASHSEEEWRVLTQKALLTFDGYIGVNNHMGSRLTLQEPAMRVVSEVLNQKGLFFVDSRTNAHSLAEKTARDNGVKAAGRDVFLDDTQTTAAVQASLAKVEQMARHNGSVIAIGHPHGVTLEALERWIPEAQSRGYVFVPVKDLVH